MKSLLLSVFALVTLFTNGQENWCGSTPSLNRLLKSNPQLMQEFYNEYKGFKPSVTNGNERAVYQIPVVFHVMHDNGVGLVGPDQIQNALDIMNLDFQRLNADTVDTRNTVDAPFKPIAAGIDLEFKLAKIDPNNNCTNGILIVNSPSLTYNADDDVKFTANGGSDAWPRDKYFNIWVVNSIAGDGGGTTLGYAQFPFFGAAETFGIVIRADYLGEVGIAANNNVRVLTHEVGHCMGLFHIFDEGSGFIPDGCDPNEDCAGSGDLMCDTPPQASAQASCSPTLNTCNDVPLNSPFGFNTLDQIENYMSYDLGCQNMFTQDQINRVTEVLTNNVPNGFNTDYMVSLTSSANASATGINNPDILCKAEFMSDQQAVCPNTTINFYDFSYHGATTWTWSVSPGTEGVDYIYSGGTDASSQNPQIQFLTGGFYDVSLFVSDGTISDTETKSDYIQVLPVANTIPFIERFEDYTSLSTTDQWTVYNPGNNNTWEIFTGFGHTGNQCIGINNFAESGANTDEVLAAPLDLSVVDTAQNEIVTMSFRYAYRKKNTSDDEWLKVFVSQDCGENWAQRKTIHGSLLSTLVETTSWQPAGQDDWTTVHMTNITAAYFVDNFLYKFEFEGSGGNNFYLDDINIYKGAPSDNIVGGISEDEMIADFGVYPNPTDDQLTVRFTLGVASDLEIVVRDITGKEVKKQFVKASTGTNLVLMDLSECATGAYLVEINSGNTKKIERVIKK